MKPARIALYLALVWLFSACAYIPPTDTAMRRAGPDYVATNGIEDVHAYVYGNVTLLEFVKSTPVFLVIRDESGASVGYEKTGRFYRLERAVDSFTVFANGRSVTFTAPMSTRVFSAPTTVDPASALGLDLAKAEGGVARVAVEVPKAKPGDENVIALLKLCESQLAEIRDLFDEASKNPKVTGQELFDLHERLDQIEARVTKASTAVVNVFFPTGGTAFRPSPEVARVLIASARAATRINIRGRTDSSVAGPNDARIALGRALAARKFLIDHGVGKDKISIFSKANGDFIAPNATKKGRALNRRVGIEFVNGRIAEMFQSTPVTGRQCMEGVPLLCRIIPLKGEVSNRSLFSIKRGPFKLAES